MRAAPPPISAPTSSKLGYATAVDVRVTIAIVLAGCANAQSGFGVDASFGDGSGGGGTATHCGAGELATDVGPTGLVTCAKTAPAVQAAIDASCSIYFGWRDDCDGCTTPPAKWGRVGGATCVNGAGVNNNCTTPTLGGQMVSLFKLDPDGDVDGNDKLYTSLHCAAAAPGTVATAPCKTGEFVDGKIGSTWTCASVSVAMVNYIHDNCSLYTGWQDGCDGCGTPPGKWGFVAGSKCMNGAGGDNTCSTAMLGTESVTLFGLNPDGDVDGNDKLHIGLRCNAAAPAMSMQTMGCPMGQFVVGTSGTGFECESLASAAVQYFTEHCSIIYGWRDGCDGCTTPPAKWGRTNVTTCNNGVGGDNTCTMFSLGGQPTVMFGLNPDGDVDGNDGLYVGFQCR